MSAGVRLRKLSRKDIHFLDGGRRCEELRCFGHQRCSNFAREMSLPTLITWKCVNDSERGLIHPNREPRHRLRLFLHERQSAAQKRLDFFLFSGLGLEFYQQCHSNVTHRFLVLGFRFEGQRPSVI